MRTNVIISVVAIVLIVLGAYEILNYHPSTHLATSTRSTSSKATTSNSVPAALSQDPKFAEQITGISPFYVVLWLEAGNLSQLPHFGNATHLSNTSMLGNVGLKGYAFEVLAHNSSTIALVGFAKLNSSLDKNYVFAIASLLGSNFTLNGSGNYNGYSYFYGEYAKAGVAVGFNGTVFVAVFLNGTTNNPVYSKQLLMDQVNSLLVNSTLSITPPQLLPKLNMPLVGWGYVNGTPSLFPLLNTSLSSGYIGLYANSSSVLTLGLSQYANASQAKEAFSSIASNLENFTKNYTTGEVDGATYVSYQHNTTEVVVAQYENYLIYAAGNNVNALQAVIQEIKILSS